jgi:hypothetical protein
VYSPSKTVNATLSATASASDIGASTPYIFVSQGATVGLPLTARVLSNGIPRNNLQVNFTVVNGVGSLSSASAQSNTNGYATVTVSVTQIAALVQVSACVAPGNAPCGMFYVSPVALAQQRLQQVSGAGQVSTGPAFQPVVVRVTDSSAAPNAVMAAPVIFLTTVLRPGGTASGGGGGDADIGNPAMPVILKVTQSSTTTDVNGLASIVPSSGGFSAPVEVDVGITAGTSGALDDPLQVFAAPYGSASSNGSPPATHPIAIPVDRGGIR